MMTLQIQRTAIQVRSAWSPRRVARMRTMGVIVFQLILMQNILFARQFGETVAATFSGGYATKDRVVVYGEENNNIWAATSVLWESPKGSSIRSVRNKKNSSDLLVLLDNKKVYRLQVVPTDFSHPPKLGTVTFLGQLGTPGYSESFDDCVGDALYTHSNLFTYVYRDSVSSWRLDTTGLNGATINDISLDTAQYVYAATTRGVFKQHPDSNVWHQLTNLPTDGYQSILADRRNRIFAAYFANFSGRGTYVSSDNGSTWTQDSAGIGTMQIMKLSDDAFGNTYALNTNRFYRRKNNTAGWTRIEGGITAMTVNPTTINEVGGDSILSAATSFGFYRSTDQGTTWTDANAGIPAQNFYAFAKGGGKWLTSTSLAIFSKSPAETTWSKAYPTAGYMGSLPIYTDGMDNIYTSYYNNATFLYKSSDNGSTWSLDTVGLKALPNGTVYIDEKGGQHIASSPSSGTCLLFVKSAGGSWGLDTAGFQLTSAYSYSSTATMVSDRSGYLYISGTYLNGTTPINGKVMRRPITGGKWAPDTAGLSSYGFLRVLVPGRNGEMYGEIGSNIVHRVNGTWSTINSPVIAGSSINRMAMSVDSSGALFIYALGWDVNNIYRGLGVYFSADIGATWKYAGLDSITVNQLVSYGDSTYAATSNGLYILTRKAAGTTAVRQDRSAPMSYSLSQNYPNPFNPITTIRFSLAQRGIISLRIFDMLGREVATLVNGELAAGPHQAIFDASKFASGIYLYRITAGAYKETKKLVVLK